MKKIKFILVFFSYYKKILLTLMIFHTFSFVISKFYVIYYQKQLKNYDNQYNKLQHLKRKIYKLFNYNDIDINNIQ
jgi:hypothetical protein